MENFEFNEYKPRGKQDQYFLKKKNIVKEQIKQAKIGHDDVVLEIGAGVGNITKLILKQNPKKIKIIEKDKKLIDILKKKFSDKKVEIIHGNALKKEFGKFNKSIANLPYSISSDITFKLFEYEFDLAIWMYQKEFAERMVADAGNKQYGRLSIGIGYFADVEIINTVSKTFFEPQPEVDSAIVKIKPKEKKKDLLNKKLFFELTKAVFTQRRKKLKNAIKNTTHMINGFDDEVFEKVKPKIKKYLELRPEDIKPDEYVKIANEIEKTMSDEWRILFSKGRHLPKFWDFGGSFPGWSITFILKW